MFKKLFLMVLIVIVSSPLFSLAGRGCCSRHGGQSYCGSNGMRICVDGTQSPTCFCAGGYNQPSLSRDQKCNLRYPGTVYRYSDDRCACPGDPMGTSTRSSSRRSCVGPNNRATISIKDSLYSSSTLRNNSYQDAKCNAKYSGTVYRSADNWCACPNDSVGMSTWNSTLNCTKQPICSPHSSYNKILEKCLCEDGYMIDQERSICVKNHQDYDSMEAYNVLEFGCISSECATVDGERRARIRSRSISNCSAGPNYDFQIGCEEYWINLPH